MTAASNTFTSSWNPSTTNAADYRGASNTAFVIPAGYGGVWRVGIGLNSSNTTSPLNLTIQLYNTATGALVPTIAQYGFNLDKVYQMRPLTVNWEWKFAAGDSIQPQFLFSNGTSGDVITYFSNTYFSMNFVTSDHA